VADHGGDPTTFARLRADVHPLPVTRPRALLTIVVPLPVAVAAGLAVGWSPHAALVAAAAVASALVLGLRLEWAALAVIATAVFDSYLDRLSPWTGEWLVAVLVVAWAVRRARGPLHRQRLLAVVVPAAALGAAVLLAAAVHPLGRASVDVGSRYAQLAVASLVLADCLSGPLPPRRAARVYVASCVLASLCGILAAALDERHRVTGPLAGPDELAFFLVAAVPLVRTLGPRGGRTPWWVVAALGALVVAGVGTQSRGALVALVVMVVVAVLTGQLALRHAGALLAVGTTLVALVIAVLPDTVGQAVTDPQRYAETNVGQRNELRRAAFEMTRASPVVGLGPGAFALSHDDYREAGEDPVGRDVDVAFSTPLEASAELGALGAIALYAVWAVPAIRARRRWLRDRRRLVAWALLAVDGLLVASFVETAQYLLPLWFLAAMVLALSHPVRPRLPLFGGAGDEGSSGQVVART
jgi:hypothetical protein